MNKAIIIFAGIQIQQGLVELCLWFPNTENVANSTAIFFPKAAHKKFHTSLLYLIYDQTDSGGSKMLAHKTESMGDSWISVELNSVMCFSLGDHLHTSTNGNN